jgi:hypothetical protein
MAAVSEAHLGEVVDLRQVDADELEPILEVATSSARNAKV